MMSRIKLGHQLEREREQRIRVEAALDAAERSRERIEALYAEAETAHAEVAEQADILATITAVSRIALSELDLAATVQAVTDAATRVTHAGFGAFFYNVTNDEGETFVLKAGPKYELLHTNRVGEKTLASPALVDGCWYFRTDRHLVCIGKKG